MNHCIGFGGCAGVLGSLVVSLLRGAQPAPVGGQATERQPAAPTDRPPRRRPNSTSGSRSTRIRSARSRSCGPTINRPARPAEDDQFPAAGKAGRRQAATRRDGRRGPRVLPARAARQSAARPVAHRGRQALHGRRSLAAAERSRSTAATTTKKRCRSSSCSSKTARDDKRLPLWGFLAAFATNDYDLAESYLKQAQANGVLADPASMKDPADQAVLGLVMQYAGALPHYRELWAKEQAIRAAEAAGRRFAAREVQNVAKATSSSSCSRTKRRRRRPTSSRS